MNKNYLPIRPEYLSNSKFHVKEKERTKQNTAIYKNIHKFPASHCFEPAKNQKLNYKSFVHFKLTTLRTDVNNCI